MKKVLILLGMLAMAAPARADLSHKISSSVQLNVNSAATQATRIGNSYSISGNNVTTSDGTNSNALTTGSITSGIYDPGPSLQLRRLLVKHSLSAQHLLRQMQFKQLLLL